MADRWTRRIARAAVLAAAGGPAATLLAFYERLLVEQKTLCDSLPASTGRLEHDLDAIVPRARRMIQQIASIAPAPLAEEAHDLLASDATVREALMSYWRDGSDRRFFAKAIVQPYAESLADAGVRPIGRPESRTEMRCPLCGGAPQLSIVQAAGSAPTSESGGRYLLCATCLMPWPFRRVRCAHCGQEDEARLGYFQAPDPAHIRIDACDACGRYLKSIDLTRLGIAVPIVDEVAAVALDAWARERGYQKIELNLVGT